MEDDFMDLDIDVDDDTDILDEGAKILLSPKGRAIKESIKEILKANTNPKPTAQQSFEMIHHIDERLAARIIKKIESRFSILHYSQVFRMNTTRYIHGTNVSTDVFRNYWHIVENNYLYTFEIRYGEFCGTLGYFKETKIDSFSYKYPKDIMVKAIQWCKVDYRLEFDRNSIMIVIKDRYGKYHTDKQLLNKLDKYISSNYPDLRYTVYPYMIKFR